MAQAPHKPTNRMRKRVRLLVASGMGEHEIATAMNVARETLRKHYPEELLHGRVTFRRELLEMLETAARKGNVTAMKHLDARTSGEVQANVVGAVGKKVEQAKVAAQAGAGTEWGDDLKPIVVSRAN